MTKNERFPATCSELVRRSTGHAATPFTRAYGKERCGRPTTWVLTANGEVYAWSCNRHRKVLEAIKPEDRGEIVAVDPIVG